MKLEIEVNPSIIIPSRDFLIGAIFGINTMRQNLPLSSKSKSTEEKEEDEKPKLGEPIMGHWLEVTCSQCQRFYGFDNPNEIPAKNLICDTPGCGNHIIVYGVGDPKSWRLGSIVFVK